MIRAVDDATFEGFSRGAEVFWHDAEAPLTVGALFGEGGERLPSGFYWWSCQPGCLPEGDAYGPYETAREAYDAAHEYDDEEVGE